VRIFPLPNLTGISSLVSEIKYMIKWMKMICPICVHFVQKSHKLHITFLFFAEHCDIVINIANLKLSCSEFEYQLRLCRTSHRPSWRSFYGFPETLQTNALTAVNLLFIIILHFCSLLCNMSSWYTWKTDLRQSNCYFSAHLSSVLLYPLF
jgi:hypothetical protein